MSDYSSKTKSKKNNTEIEDVYKKKTLHEHILTTPDTYIGTTNPDTVNMFIYDEEQNKIVENTINYVAGFFKIFDEILVNARDHTVRDKTCKHINVTLNKQTGMISVYNDGNGIPVAIHKTENKYLPEMIFSNLLTSSNYEVKGKTVGGKNGYGSKLTNIYSKEFEIHTIGYDSIDGKDKKKIEYKQTFRNNMYDIEEPIINKKISSNAKTFTKVTFYPDYEKFGMTRLTNDMYSLLIKRCYDVAACTTNKVKISVNDNEIKCRDFSDYIKLYYLDEDESGNRLQKPKITYAKVNSRWEIGIGFNRNIGDRHISFVNGISTFQGGTHVGHVITNVSNKVIEHIKKKKEHKDLKIMTSTVKQFLTFFINCVIEDPGFNSQTKEFMNSKMADWCTCGKNCEDVKCNISDEFIQELCDNGLMAEVVSMSKHKEMRDLSKTDGKKIGSLRTVDKLIDADRAGKQDSHKTALILTEGDSAKAFAVSGLSVIGGTYHGVFPLRGKLLNVRNATAKQIQANKEFINIKTIMGLKQGMKYKDTSKLRYGSIIILTDQDPDGSHIKGLIINMFEYFWPELLQIPGFIKAYNTPIVKVWKKSDTKKQNVKEFYTLNEFEKWAQKQESLKDWVHKYYKGLGTSTDKEAKESFYKFSDNLVTFLWENEEGKVETTHIDADNVKLIEHDTKEDTDISDTENKEQTDDDKSIDYTQSQSHISITKAFDEKQSAKRKEWLKKFKREDLLEYKANMKVSYTDFIDRDLIFFSNLDNDRSIPSMTDGLKPSQRMILYCCFKRGRRAKEIKVAQLSGYVSENTDYHHGEMSLQGAIIGLAQNFPGSNNINLLTPNGNFGYRRQGGKDHASARYIHTQLDPVACAIFREEDEEILTYNYDDDRRVEPVNYAPIIPMVLVNGSQGIGTGFSTNIPPHNPRDIVANLKRMLNDDTPKDMIPWFNGFKGTIEHNGDNKYIVRGKYTIDGNIVHIEDIPIINGWIEPYESKMQAKESVTKDDDSVLENFKSHPGNNIIDMTLTFRSKGLQSLYKSGMLDKYLHMTQNMSVTNLHLFNSQNKITKYDYIEDIMYDFYDYRLSVYEVRKEFFLKKLQNDLDIYRYKVKFIEEYLNGTLLIAKQKVTQVIKQLEDKKYPRLANDHRASDDAKSYRYLTDMTILTLTEDKISELKNKMKECQMKYDEYLNTPIKDIWNRELDEFLVAYDKWYATWESENFSKNIDNKKTKSSRNKKDTKKTKRVVKKN